MRLYVNGVLGESRTHTGRTPVATTAPIFFGTDGDTYAYHGSLDDTRIYNRALTGAEVAALAGWNGSGENGKIDVCTPAGWTPWGE